MNSLQLSIGDEQVILPDGLQPFVFQTREGRLIAQAQMPVPIGTLYPGEWKCVLSDDGGQNWSEKSWDNVPGGSPFFENCAAQLSDGTILWFGWSAKGPHEGGVWIARLWESNDNLETLQGPEEARALLPQAKGGYDDDGHPAGEVFFHRTLLEMPNGELLLTAYGWFHEDNIPSTYMPSMNRFRTILLKSSDRGRNWSLLSTVSAEPTGEEGFNEPVMIRISKGEHAGRLLVLLRCGSNKTYPHNPIYQTHSDDDGLTWSQPHALPFENVDPDLIEMSNGVLVASYGWRTMESRVHHTPEPKTMGEGHGNYIAFSFDGGDSWTNMTQVTREPSTCYTAVREIAPNKLILVYDIGDGWHHVWKGYENIRRGLGCRIIEVSFEGGRKA